jgi:hypothetical protein
MAAIVGLCFRDLGGYIAASALVLIGLALIIDGWLRRRKALPEGKGGTKSVAVSMDFRAVAEESTSRDNDTARLRRASARVIEAYEELVDSEGAYSPSGKDDHALASTKILLKNSELSRRMQELKSRHLDSYKAAIDVVSPEERTRYADIYSRIYRANSLAEMERPIQELRLLVERLS